VNVLPHVENIYTLIAVLGSGALHLLTARASKKRTLTIKMLVNGRLSETLLRNEHLAHVLSEHNIPIPPQLYRLCGPS